MMAHKFTLNTNVYMTPKLSINPTIIYGGKRYAYTTVNEDYEPISNELKPYLLTNIFLNYRGLLTGMTLGAGVYDLLNERPAIPQAYNGGTGAYAPIPARSREYIAKLAYQINFKNKP
jgi:outer membrane receptor protein involved in Fe transport